MTSLLQHVRDVIAVHYTKFYRFQLSMALYICMYLSVMWKITCGRFLLTQFSKVVYNLLLLMQAGKQFTCVTHGWFRGSAVERWSLTGELSLSCARPTADGWPLMWVNRQLKVSQFSLSSFWVDKWVVTCKLMSSPQSVAAPSGECERRLKAGMVLFAS